ncbi:MAG TPA: oxygen-independent coproporphyrinogen III oxidase [Burkholderiaceae bacterium]|nr:oxygen-independent coproporphyrinogen III oxidase [Burkholderiaceae bacterium]
MPCSTLDAPCEFDAELIQRLDRRGPRYTSYPTADRFHDHFGLSDYMHAVRTRTQRALSMYVHIPFCESVCYYCACNKVVTRRHDMAEEYLRRLLRELELHAAMLGGGQRIEQSHLGGGTPTYFSDTQLARLMGAIRAGFGLAADDIGEFSIEVDPRTVTPERIAHLRAFGFNRLSFGVQDFDPAVQKAVHREQSFEQTHALVAAARDARFRSVSIDLIYGLPLQTPASFTSTIGQLCALNPDRVAVYSYAHLPQVFKPQRRIDTAQLPTPASKLDLLRVVIERLTQAGYAHIGMDHFAKMEDSLAVAQRQGRLHRNFQGYSTHASANLIGVGVSAIGAMGATYSQNEKDLARYNARIDAGEIPIARGVALSRDDVVRRSVIQALLCHNELSKRAIETTFSIGFDEYFESELRELEAFAMEGLVELDDDWITISPRGRLLARNIAMPFDRYLREHQTANRYSRTIG